MPTLVLALRVLLGAVFLTAAIGKLADIRGSRQAMRDFGLRGPAADAVGVLLPVAELATAAALIVRPTAQWGGLAALILLLAFMAGIGNAMRLGMSPECHCFGQIQSSPAGRGTLLRNAVLAAISVVIVGWGSGPAITTWVDARSAAELAAIGTGVCAVVFGALALQMRQRLSRLGESLGMAQRMAATMPPGIPIGTPAPDFSLSGLDGEEVTLDALLAPGRPSLLVFISPTCYSCMELLPKLTRWKRTLAERLTVAVISTGSLEDNRPTIEEHGLDDMLLQERAEVIEAYRIRGTPAAVLLTPAGAIASNVAESVSGIEPLIRLALRGTADPVADASIA